MPSDTAGPDAVLAFWIAAGERAWFRKDPAFDADMARRFGATLAAASPAMAEAWATTPDGALAFVLLCDQFPRNIHRGTAAAFATDALALAAAEGAIARGFDAAVPADLRPFFYLPFEHAEDGAAQARAVALFAAHARETGREDYLRFARLHADLIDRFGRFPHRNALLGRPSTSAEIAYLAGGGFAG